MRANLARFAFLLLGLMAWAACAESTSEVRELLPDSALLTQLRHGGFNLYFRHTSTDFGQNDEAMRDYADCAKQRNLTDRGRDEARQIGEAVRQLAIPVGEVIASPFCRTKETANLAFGRATPSTEVFAGGLAKLLATPPAPGTNRMIVSHGNPFFSVVGPPRLAEGEAAVVKPAGDAYTVIARIRVEDWGRLLAVK